MALLEIKTLDKDEEILRRKAEPVTQFTPELRTLVQDMIETMHDAPGVGLAAPQIGQSLQLLVVGLPEREDEPLSGKPFALANPKIVEASAETVKGMEGCLSIPEYVGEVTRHVEITVQGRNEWGKPKTIKAKGYLARVLQHEIDHLEGTLYIDRLGPDDKFFKHEPRGEGDEGEQPPEVADPEASESPSPV